MRLRPRLPSWLHIVEHNMPLLYYSHRSVIYSTFVVCRSIAGLFLARGDACSSFLSTIIILDHRCRAGFFRSMRMLWGTIASVVVSMRPNMKRLEMLALPAVSSSSFTIGTRYCTRVWTSKMQFKLFQWVESLGCMDIHMLGVLPCFSGYCSSTWHFWGLCLLISWTRVEFGWNETSTIADGFLLYWNSPNLLTQF